MNVLFEDSKGHIWIATDKGVCRYDGKHFLAFNTDNGLTSNMVYAIGEDSNGNMYFGMFEGGLARWDGIKLEKVQMEATTISSIDSDEWGRVYVLGNDNLFVLDGPHSKTFPLGEDFVYAKILKATDHRFFVIGQFNTFQITASKEKVATENLATKNKEVGAVLRKEKFLAMREKSGKHASQFSKFYEPKIIVRNNATFFQGKYYSFDRTIPLIVTDEHSETIYGVENGLPESPTTSLLTDENGCLWIGTFGQGIRIWQGNYLTWYDRPNSKITSISFDANNPYFTTNTGAWTVSKDKKSILQVENGNLTHYLKSPLGEFRGTLEGGVQKKGRNGVWENLYFESSGVSSFFVGNDTIFTGMYGSGVAFVPINKGETQSLMTKHGLADLMVEQIIPLKKGFAATSFSKGISFVGQNRQVTVIDQSKGLLSNTVYCIFEMPDGKIWVGTEHGVTLLNPDKTIFGNYGGKEGIVGTKVINVFIDHLGRVWALTDKYLHLWEKNHWRAIKSHPLLPDKGLFINRSAINPARNLLYLGLNKGLAVIDIDRIFPINASPPKIEPHIYIDGTPLENNHHLKTGFPLLELSITFPVKHFLPALAPKLWLKLDGYDTEWILAPEYETTYKRVPPGNYSLMAFWESPDGAINNKYEVFQLYVASPFWLQAWFVALCGIIAIGIAYLSVRFMVALNLRRRMRMFEIKQRIQAERERISRDLHDNVGAQITQAIRHLDILAFQSHKIQSDEAAQKLDQTAHRLRNTMQLLRDTIWALREESVTFGIFENRLRSYLVAYLGELEMGPTWTLKTNDSANKPIPPTLALTVFRIIQESAQNMLKHADAKHFSIEMAISNDILHLSITDDGNGPPDNFLENVSGDGIGNMRSRTEEAGGTFQIGAPKTGKGCQILVEIPIVVAQ